MRASQALSGFRAALVAPQAGEELQFTNLAPEGLSDGSDPGVFRLFQLVNRCRGPKNDV